MKYGQWLDSSPLIKVSGRGTFPVDMLRRECSWPNTTRDAYRILHHDQRSITLRLSKARNFVPDRWTSFGWVAELHEDE